FQLALQQRLGLQRLGSVLGADCESGWIHRNARILALGIEYVEIEAEVRVAFFVEEAFFNSICFDSLERLDAGILGMGSASHAFDDEIRRRFIEFGSPAPG